MRVLAVAVGVVLLVVVDASAQERCSRRYYGEEHSGAWQYLTIDATSRGMPASSGITIYDRPTLVCGHNGQKGLVDDGRDDDYYAYCAESVAHEWRRVWACGSGGNGGRENSRGRVRLSMADDSEWVMEDAGPTQVTVKAELTGDMRDVSTRVNVRLDPYEASMDDFEASEQNLRIDIPANRRSGSRSLTFTPVDDTTEESDENLRFSGDTGAANLPVDPTTLMIKDNDAADDDPAGTTVGDPAFSERSYVFDLPEERDGRTDPYRLGVVTATDPAEHRLTYALATGDGSRFEVGASSGAIDYVGPGEDYESGPRNYELTLAARNGDGRTASARVTVRVTNVAETPAAADDAVEMPEDETIVVDVLANDTDGDGDSLTVVSVSAPEHGEAMVAHGGGVRYEPSLHYHGPDRFDYTVSDPGGLTDTATVTLDVLPVNDAPQAVGKIPEQALEEGGEPVTLDLAPYFTDIDGDALTYTAESSNAAATTVAMSGSTLTLSAVVRGAAAVTVTASDPDGLTATQVFGASVGDELVREVLTDLLAGFARGHLSSVRQTVGRRLETAGAETPHLALAGRYFSPLLWNRLGAGGLARTHEWYFRAAVLQQRRAATELLGTSADPRFRESDGFLGVGSFGGGWNRALLGSSLLLPFGGGGEGGPGSGRGRPRWTVWGQGDLQTFRGTPGSVSGYEGDLRTGYLGVDVQVTGGWLLGVAMARSGGAGAWERGESGGELSTTLTRVHPYVRWANDDTAVWGVLGVGRGRAGSHVRTLTGLRETSDLGLGLGLLEGRRRVATVGGGVDIGLRGEASWARLATGDGDETIDDLEAGVRRVRAGVELLRAISGAGGLTWTPFGAVSTRHDGGAGQTGVGLEVAGGLRVRSGPLRLEAQGRRLLVHSATGYEEQGASLAAMVGAGPFEPGLTLSVRPTWGAPGMGAETLWQDRFHTYRQGTDYEAAGIDARVGYGVGLPWGSVLTPFGAIAQREDNRRFEVGAMMASVGDMPGVGDSPIQLEISGERYERPGARPDHRVGMFGVVRLGGGKASPESAPNGDPAARAPALVPAAVPDARQPATLRSKPLWAALPLDERFAPAPVEGCALPEMPPAAAPAVVPAPVASRPAATTRAAGARRRSAVADAARTYRAVPVLIDVLANDVRSDGLRIVAMTAPAHGTATVADGMVRYAPEPGHRGRDAFTYTVVGAGGRTSRATVTVTVMDAE